MKHERRPQDGRPVVIATKFRPRMTRWSADSVLAALDASLRRLEVHAVDLCQIHMPVPHIKVEALMDAMEMGILTGKYEVAADRHTTVQAVAPNWLLSRDDRVIPIPGAKNKQQAEANLASLGWRLNREEFERISASATAF